MTHRRFFVGRTIALIALLLVGGVVGFYAFNAYIYHQKQGDGSEIQAYRGTLEGEYVCMGSESDTAACAKGLLVDDGSLYAIDFTVMSQLVPSLIVGNRIRATGLITPIELLSTDHWQQYGVSGIFSVTDSVVVL